MSIRHLRLHSFTCVFLCCCLLSTTLLSAAPPDVKGKPPKDDPPSSAAPVEYSIEVVPIPPSGSVRAGDVRGLNHFAMMVGNYRTEDLTLFPFLFDATTGLFYDFRAEPDLTQQLELLQPGLKFRATRGINDAGVVVGIAYDPDSGLRQGVVVDTSLSSNVADWVVHLIPKVGDDNYSFGVDINLWGDVLGYCEYADGTRDRFIYNPFDEPLNPPTVFNIHSLFLFESGNINDNLLVAHRGGEAIRVFDASVNPPNLVNTILIEGVGDNISLNNSGVIGTVTTAQRVGGKGKQQDSAIQLDAVTGVTDTLLSATSYSLWTYDNQFLNSQGDMTVTNGDHVDLIHQGFTSDPQQTIWNVDDLIAADDPWRNDWINSSSSLSVAALTDRSDTNDSSGFPVMAGTFVATDGQVKCAVLIPTDLE